MKIPDWLLKETFVVQHSPNCPSMFLVRLVGYHCGYIDLKPYNPMETRDALGFGITIEEAADNAMREKEQQKIKFITYQEGIKNVRRNIDKTCI